MWAFLVLFFEGNEEIVGEGFFAEVAFVEGLTEHGFVEALELGEGEFRRKQLEADGLVGQLATEAGERGIEDLSVIESKRWDDAHGEPFGLGGIGRSTDNSRFDEGKVGHADNPLTRIATHTAKSVELLQIHLSQPRFLFQLATSSLIQCFFNADKPSRQCPLILERLQSSSNQQHLQLTTIKTKNHAINSDCRSRIFISVIHTRILHESVSPVKTKVYF